MLTTFKMSIHKNKQSGKFHKERGIQHARCQARVCPRKVCGTDCEGKSDREARQVFSNELGHGRIYVTKVYLGK